VKRHRDGNRLAFIAGPEQAQDHFRRGIDIIADMLAPTLGPTGAIVANQHRPDRAPELLDDAATAARRVLSLGDQRLDVGAMLLRNLVWRVTGQVGDGGATTALLARALYRECLKLVQTGVNPVHLADGVRQAAAAVIAHLSTQSRPVRQPDELSAVALAAVREPDLAAVLGEMAYLLGPDARVNVERYVAAYLESEFFPGVNYEAEIASYHLYTHPHLKRAIHSACAVALLDEQLLRVPQAVRLLEAAVARGDKSLLILAHGFRDEALHVLTRNQNEKESKIKVVAATLKLLGDERQHAFEDLALLTGASLLGRGPSALHQIDYAQSADLGRAQRVEVGTQRLQLIPFHTNAGAVQVRIAQIRQRLDHLPHDDAEHPKLTRRLAALNGGMGVIKVGAPTEAEREVRAKAAERGMKALSAAQKGGVLPGAGAALARCAPALAPLLADPSLREEVRMGVQAMSRILDVPLRQILRNAGEESPGGVAFRIQEAGDFTTYDALTGQVVDGWQAGVLDPADVVIATLRVAVSGAMMALSTDTIVYHSNPERKMEP
jgi:chaperonin GroEL